jgi:hypothetical protein
MEWRGCRSEGYVTPPSFTVYTFAKQHSLDGNPPPARARAARDEFRGGHFLVSIRRVVGEPSLELKARLRARLDVKRPGVGIVPSLQIVSRLV